MIETTQKCNRCGYCCACEICKVGKMVFPDSKPPCPLLMKISKSYACKLVMIESTYGLEPLLKETLAIGRGCDTF